MEQFGRIVNNPLETAKTCHSVGWSLIYRGEVTFNPEVAVALYRRASEIDPEQWWYLWCLGMAHCRTGQWEQAVDVLSRANEMPDGRDALNFLFLAMAQWQLRNRTAAIESYNNAIEWIYTKDLEEEMRRYVRPLGVGALQVYNGEVAQVIGVKQKEFFRQAPLVGRRVSTVSARTDGDDSADIVAHIIDGTGVADADGDRLFEHSEEPKDMWLSAEGREVKWIEFDLGDVHELESILVWNYNHKGHTNRGIKSADISVWTEDSGWRKLRDDAEFAQAEGSFDYDEPTLVKFDAVKAQKVRFEDINGIGDSGYVGLSEIRFYEKYDPDAAESPSSQYAAPPSQAGLTWEPNDEYIDLAFSFSQHSADMWGDQQ
jgi:hypothetical protein